MLKYKKGDLVKITSGKDKGKQGKIDSVAQKGQGVIVASLNLMTKHKKPVSEGQSGGRIQLPGVIAAGKFTVICSKCNKPTRIGFKLDGGDKIRVCKKCGASL